MAEPKVNDLYVVRFQPTGSTDTRYYFYRLYRVTSDSAYFHPARQPVATPDAIATSPNFFAPKSVPYTRQELQELTKEQPGDEQKTVLVSIRRE
ncbi:hypothetical protein [Hymenobacter sp. BT491]|uniref:hypothetical protein n=1 Tax=Hymenobacter sp. BT491 TaxID=2766779 RepID=UPI001653E150|nr:hypothetical protein [Hymenobacter sp. BT491]MBC6988437.1 hypothetical protein [Hymenobacter sp. BT491]